MSYNTMNIDKNGVAPITPECLKELYKIKEEIFSNGQHKGKKFEVVFEAFCQIKKHYGQPKPSRACKSGCIKFMNDLLKNWFNSYEANGGQQPSIEKEVKTVEDKQQEYDNLSYGELKDLLKEKIGLEAFKLINGIKPAKKAQVIEELLKLQYGNNSQT